MVRDVRMLDYLLASSLQVVGRDLFMWFTGTGISPKEYGSGIERWIPAKGLLE
jgi:hypothetical protein